MDRCHLVLGSSSPRRAELLRHLGLSFDIVAPEVDEVRKPAEDWRPYLDRVVLAKLTAARDLTVRDLVSERPLRDRVGAADCVVLAADTIVVRHGDVFGKPKDQDDAARMMRLLSGTTHEVSTRFALHVHRPSAREHPSSAHAPHAASVVGAPAVAFHAETVTSRVTFRALSEDEIQWYLSLGEGVDKAGGYAVQGAGAFAIARIEGSYTAIVGLPSCELVSALRRHGFESLFSR